MVSQTNNSSLFVYNILQIMMSEKPILNLQAGKSFVGMRSEAEVKEKD